MRRDASASTYPEGGERGDLAGKEAELVPPGGGGPDPDLLDGHEAPLHLVHRGVHLAEGPPPWEMMGCCQQVFQEGGGGQVGKSMEMRLGASLFGHSSEETLP